MLSIRNKFLNLFVHGVSMVVFEHGVVNLTRLKSQPEKLLTSNLACIMTNILLFVSLNKNSKWGHIFDEVIIFAVTVRENFGKCLFH